jgi:hypothetical protein
MLAVVRLGFIAHVALISVMGGVLRTSWPAIAPTNKIFRISDPSHALIKTYLRSPSGKPLYLFVCRAGRDEYADSLGVNYAGDLDCRLVPASLGEVEMNLLVEQAGLAAWYSRGRMNASDLYGPCATYPEYGTVRHFRLRGMKLTIRFTDVAFAEEVIGSGNDALMAGKSLRGYMVRLTAVPDSAASSAIAASSGYLDPHREQPGHPRSCRVVERGREWR